VHRIFSPTQHQIVVARKICAAFETAERDGVAAIVVDGTFVGYPVVHKAFCVVATGDRLEKSGKRGGAR
jgi:citrate lyase subunit beta / citryl-CoA lyase